MDLWLTGVLFVATLLAYAPALSGEFLLDDDVHVTRPELRSLAGLGRIWTEIGVTQQYYPLLHTAFWFEQRLWGDAVVGYHLVNVLLHATAACLLVPLMRRLSLPGGWLAAFLFALHPVGVESVAWISEQKNTLSLVFALGAAIAYLKFDHARSRASYGLATALFALALLSKTATATVPGALLVLVWWRRGGLDWKRDVRPLLPWFAAALGAGLVTLHVEHGLIAGIDADVSLTWVERWLVAGRVLWFHLGKILWPANLTLLYERWLIAPTAIGQHGFPVAAVVVLIGSAWVVRRCRGPLAAVLVFGGTLLPVLGLVNVEWFVFSFVADHFQYLAMTAVIVPLSAVATRFAEFERRHGTTRPMVAASVCNWMTPPLAHARRHHQGAVVLAAAILLALGILTCRHSATFRSHIGLYRHAVARSPNSVVAHHLLGVALAKAPGGLPEAIAQFEAALALNPRAAETHENLGLARRRMPGRAADAVAHLEAALQLKPTLTRIRPALAAAHFDVAKAQAARPGAEAGAITHYEAALRHRPDFGAAHYNLANLLLRDPRRLADAIRHLEAAVQVKPDFAEARTNLGVALARVPGRLDDAIAHFEAALRINPEYSPARNNLQKARALRETRQAPRPP